MSLKEILKFIVALGVILLVLRLFGVTPTDVGHLFRDAFNAAVEFFRALDDGPGLNTPQR